MQHCYFWLVLTILRITIEIRDTALIEKFTYELLRLSFNFLWISEKSWFLILLRTDYRIILPEPSVILCGLSYTCKTMRIAFSLIYCNCYVCTFLHVPHYPSPFFHRFILGLLIYLSSFLQLFPFYKALFQFSHLWTIFLPVFYENFHFLLLFSEISLRFFK